MCSYISFLKDELSRSTVELRLGTELDPETAMAFDRVIVATGGSCRDYLPAGVDGAMVMDAWKALQAHTSDFAGRDVLVVGAGSVGCETALHLASGGARVSLVEIRGMIAADVDMISRITLMRELERAAVAMYPSATVSGVQGGKAVLKNEGSGAVWDVPCTLVVTAVGAQSEHGLADRLVERAFPVIVVGDAVTIGKIGDAVRGGFNAAANI